MELIQERHYLGKLCPKQHEWLDTGKSRRFRSTRGCTICVAEKKKIYESTEIGQQTYQVWAQKNKAKRTAQARVRYHTNPQMFIETQKRYLAAHKHDPEFRKRRRLRGRNKYVRNTLDPSFRERENARHVEYRKRHPEVGRAALIRSRARKRSQFDGDYTAANLRIRFNEFNNQCSYCGEAAAKHIDHFIPTSRGGRDGLTNIVPACQKCNLSKNASPPYTWFRKQPTFTPERWDRILAVLSY